MTVDSSKLVSPKPRRGQTVATCRWSSASSAVSSVPISDRAFDWTTTVRTVAERLNIGWCYWDYATDFGVYDAATDTWRQPLLAALIDS